MFITLGEKIYTDVSASSSQKKRVLPTLNLALLCFFYAPFFCGRIAASCFSPPQANKNDFLQIII